MTRVHPPADWRTGLRHLVSLIDATGGQNKEHLKKFDLYVTYLIPVLTPLEMVEFMEILGHDSHCRVTIDERGHTEVHCDTSCAHYRKRLAILEQHLDSHFKSKAAGQGVVACSVCGGQTRSTATKLCDRCWELKTRIQMDPGLALKLVNMAIDDMTPEQFTKFITTFVGEEIDRLYTRGHRPEPDIEPLGILNDINFALEDGSIVVLPGHDAGSNKHSTGGDRTDPTRIPPHLTDHERRRLSGG